MKKLFPLLLALCLLLSMLPGAVTAEEERAKPPDLLPHFRDVPENMWYYSSVRQAYEQGLMSGMTENEFVPGGSMTRGMYITVLGRIAGIDTADYQTASVFSDVSAKKYYAPYVNWGVEQGVVTGMDETHFAPDTPVTREQAATMLDRYLRTLEPEEPEDPPSEDPTEPIEDPTEPIEDPTEPIEDPTEPIEDPTEPIDEPDDPGDDPDNPGDPDDPDDPEDPDDPDDPPQDDPPDEEPTPLTDYVDEASISAWALPSVARLQQLGLMQGDNAHRFNPKQKITRAEGATVFVRLNAYCYGDNVVTVNVWLDRDPYPKVNNPIVTNDKLRQLAQAYMIQPDTPTFEALISINTVYAAQIPFSERNQPILFVFEGCGMIDDPGLRMNAMAIVVKDGRIVFFDRLSTSIPDYPFDPYMNDNSDTMPTMKPGIYKTTATNHNGYNAAWHIEDAEVLRFCNAYEYFDSTSLFINIHRRTTDTLAPYGGTWSNSSGCILIGRSGTDPNEPYAQFVQALGLVPEGSAGNVRYQTGVSGLFVLDRTQAADYLLAIGYPQSALPLLGAQ